MRDRLILPALIALVAAAALPAPSDGHSGTSSVNAQAVALGSPPAAAPGCPATAEAAKFASMARLARWNSVMARLGERPTASPAHQRWIKYLDGRMRSIPGMQMRSIPYNIDRWLERRTRLAAGPADALAPVAVSGAVPYSKATPRRGVTAPLVYLPGGKKVADADVAGKIVVRDATPGKVPNAVFAALEWFSWDPDLSLTKDIGSNYERDYLGYQQRIDDLEQAAGKGAAGLVFVHGFPRSQVRHQYAPYEGKRWGLPAVYVGVDQGEQLKRLAGDGASGRIRVRAAEGPARTRTMVATLPGMSEERIIVESHTDGMNAIWDNGPVGMLALARYFAALPQECRPRTLQFVFTTAHLYQYLTPDRREGAAERYAEEVDRDYDAGKIAMVMALEHMGAREYAAVERPGGLPGRMLRQTGQSEPTGIFIGESPLLVEETAKAVIGADLRRTLGLRGADLPGLHLPPHHSFGGEGTSYHKHLLPTVALVTGPWSLYNPAFGMEAVDVSLLQRQSLVFADLLHSLASQPREAIAGATLGERGTREVLCEHSPDGYGLVECPQPEG